MGCVYKLTSPSGKSYIGITSKGLAARWRQHRANAKKGRGVVNGDECCALYPAMRKYGSVSFVVDELAQSDSWEELCAMEQEQIAAYGTLSPGGYNLTIGGDGATGAVVSEASRLRMSAAQRLANLNPTLAAARLDSLSRAVEQRLKNWHARTDQEKAEWGAAHSIRVSRGHSTPESKARTSAASKRRWLDTSWRARVVEAMKGKRQPKSEAWKQQQAEKRRQEWADPVTREKRLAGFAAARAAKQQRSA